MECPLCTGKMNFNYKVLKETGRAIKGYEDVFSCGKCMVVVTIKVEQNDDIYKAIN
jgi:uncharacterized Zn finger protein